MVPVIERLRRYLLDQRARISGAIVFPDRRAPHFKPSSLTRRAERAWREAGLVGIGLHECRHTYVSRRRQRQGDLVYAGHGSVAFTLDRYGHLMPNDLEMNAARLAAYVHDNQSRVLS